MAQTEPLNGFTGFNRKTDNFRFTSTDDTNGTGVAFEQSKLDALPPLDRRWAWIEIDLGAIRHNVVEVKNRLRPGVRLMAVVKADAYGHGAVQCARTALNSGADALAVATVDEGVQLRKAGIGADILLLCEPPTTAIPIMLGYRILPTIFTPEFAMAYAETADAHAMKAPYHLGVNSGMNRIGVRAEDIIEFVRATSFHRALELRGVFTHFATADCPENIDFRRQVNRFTDAIETLRTAGINPGLVHAANSAATLRFPEVHFDMCRLGISMYGFHPCPETRGHVDLRPAMSVYARITECKNVPLGEGVSYGLNYRSPGSVKICTIPLGYADGLNRALSGRTSFILDGMYCKQVGNICMDQCMFEVDMRTYGTRRKLDPQIGDLVVVVGNQGDCVTTITEMAYTLGTIEHELCIAFSHRMPRIFV